MKKDLLNLINNFLKTNWLRPETVIWDAHLAYLVGPYLKKKNIKKLEIGVGNGITSFITLGGKLKDHFDTFSNFNTNKFNKKDIYNSFKKKKLNFIQKKINNKFLTVIDHKKNLLKNSKTLNISSNYIAHDCNKPLTLKNDFELIYTNIIYWLNEPLIFLKDVTRYLKKNGLIIFTVPNENFYNYCKSYKSTKKVWKLINMNRKNHFKFTYTKKNFLKNLRKNKRLKLIKNKNFLSRQTLTIWDIGLRLCLPEMVEMSQSLGPKKLVKVKNSWCKKLKPILIQLMKEEIKNTNKGGFDLYILKKI